ncbi:MAG: HD domain-containing protein, partial [bacterium]|nr:HD domain-containing protein [bacterium]
MVRGIKWESRKWASRILRVAVFVVPLLIGVIAATIVARAIPGYDRFFFGGVLWWTVVLGSSFITVNFADRLARKFLPLAALLDMSLVFPGVAPSRVKVAMRTWTTAQLQKRIAEARDLGIDDDPTRAGETVLLLVAALNAHDHVTRGHAERTRAYTDVLAEELGVPHDERERLRWAALLHDVGKLMIAESVLNKTGDLDEEEWEAVRRHPKLGDELVAPIKGFLAPWGDTILHHHERWDGAGYPQGLVGSEINYGARIVAVADAY